MSQEVINQYNKDHPYLARLVERRTLCHNDSEKDTQHFVVDIKGSGLTYQCGDSLGIYPQNPRDAVEKLIQELGFSGDERVRLPRSEDLVSLREAFLFRCSLAQPTKKFLEALAERVTNSGEKSRLQHLLDPERKGEMQDYLANREYLDVAEEFPSAEWDPQEYVELLRKLTPRLYSIASSPAVYPDEIHLTVAVVRYVTNDRLRHGVASTYLAERATMDHSILPVFVASSHFGLPEDKAADIIMVGPGTGVAPFRAFMQERVATGASGKNWLFFGEQRRASNFLYGDEWEELREKGHLNRLDLAFSRDQEHKIYVQHKMLENADALWEWLAGGAYFYVCGDAKRMAKDVEAALLQIAQEQGGMDADAAKDWLKQLKRDKRYQRDVY